MNGLRRRNSRGYLRSDNKVADSKKPIFFNFEYLVIVGFIILCILRVLIVITSHSTFYVEMLNVGMPIVESEIYDASEYKEHKLTLKELAVESLMLDKINLANIVSSEVSFFNDVKIDTKVEHTAVAEKGFEEFKLNESTIAKLTPEEIAQLNGVSEAYNPSLKKPLNSSKPQILIYSTHTMEHYSEADGQTTNNDVNVVGVGEILTKELEEGYGISVVHDKTNYTIADYNTAYTRSREGLQNNLSVFGDFDLVIDLHRDSLSRESAIATLNGQTLSKFRFVLSENVATYDANAAAVNELYDISTNLFPELILPTSIVPYPGGLMGYNQGFSEGSMVIEVGSNNVSAQEAKLTSKYIARILAEYLNTK